MNIIDYIESQTIRKYLQKLDYKFSADEAAFVVWQNYNKTIKEKHAAWRWIIENMDDVDLHEKFPRIYYIKSLATEEYYSLHNCLKKYIEIEEATIALATRTEEKTVFSFETYYHGDISVCEDGRLFSTYEAAAQAIETEKEDAKDYRLECIYLKKQWIDEENEKMVVLKMLPDKEVLSIYIDKNVITDFVIDIQNIFDDMWFKIPTPFEKGDIVYVKNTVGDHPSFEEPFVLKHLCYWDVEDIEDAKRRHAWGSMDMTAYGYFPYDDGTLYYECMHNYLSLEYYTDKLEDNLRTLKAVSSYLKGKIDILLLLDAQSIIVNDERNKQHVQKANYLVEYLKLAGLMEEEKISGMKCRKCER